MAETYGSPTTPMTRARCSEEKFLRVSEPTLGHAREPKQPGIRLNQVDQTDDVRELTASLVVG